MDIKKTPQEIIKEKQKEKHDALPMPPFLDIEEVEEEGELYVIISKRVHGKMEYSVLKVESEFNPIVNAWIKDILLNEKDRINGNIKDGDYSVAISLFDAPFMVDFTVNKENFGVKDIKPIIRLNK